MSIKLTAENTLILVIDIQEKLLPAMYDKEKIVKNTNVIMEIAKTYDIPVIATEQYPKGLGHTVPEITLPEGTEVFAKTLFNALIPEVKEKIEHSKAKYILITGMESHICVYQSARSLAEMGLTPVIVMDAVSSRTVENRDNGFELMRNSGAVIMNTETILFDLLEKAGTPEFKALSPLIR